MSCIISTSGVSETFTLNVRPARNFPIDLYLLMDLSFSMRDDLQNLQMLGTALGKLATQKIMQNLVTRIVIQLPYTAFQLP